MEQIGPLMKRAIGIKIEGPPRFTHLLFADDLVLISETHDDVQYMMDQTLIWAGNMKLEINALKTHYIIFNKTGISPPLNIGTTSIKATLTATYLGFTAHKLCRTDKHLQIQLEKTKIAQRMVQ
jgi:hypothetical protein